MPIRDTDKVSEDTDAPVVFATLVGGSRDQDGDADGEGDGAGEGGTPTPGSGVTISTVTQEDAPSPENRGDIDMPLGLIGFEAAAPVAECSEDAGEIPFSLLIDGDLEVNGFWKETSGGWVNLASPEFGGQVTQVGNKTQLDFVIQDNGPFDTNPAPGAVTDPGAPGYRTDLEPQPEPEPEPAPSCLYAPFQPDTDADGMPDAVEAELGFDPTLKDNDVFGNDSLFVRQLYRDLLWREGEAEGVAHWKGLLSDDSQSRTDLFNAFMASAEFQAGPGAIVELYESVLGRQPDACGLDFWMQQYQNGLPLEEVANSLIASPEFLARHGDLDEAGLMTSLYQEVLERTPTAEEHAQWTEALAEGISAGQLLLNLTQSEALQGRAQTTTQLDMLYLGMLDRGADADGYQWWQAQLDGGLASDQMTQGFLQSPEYHDRFLPPVSPEAEFTELELVGQAPLEVGTEGIA